MRRASRTAALALALALLSGCGTIANFSGKGWQHTQIYGGVLRDVKSAEDFIANNPITAEAEIQKSVGTVVGVGIISVDVPLSAIADTLTLPITIPIVLWPPPPPPPPLVVNRKGQAAAPAVNRTAPQPEVAQK